MLEGVPEDDRGEVGLVDAGDVARPDVRPRGDELEAGGVSTAAPQGVEQGAVAGADVEHRAGRRDRVEALGEGAAGALEDGVAGTREAAALRAVPALVCLLEGLLRRPRVGCRGAASLATRTAAAAVDAVRERGTAPRAGGGGHVSGRRVGDGHGGGKASPRRWGPGWRREVAPPGRAAAARATGHPR